MSFQPLTTTPVAWHVACTHCDVGNALETKSPLCICRACFDRLGARKRQELMKRRNAGGVV